MNKKLKRNCLSVKIGELDFTEPEAKFIMGVGELFFEEPSVYNEEAGKWEKAKGKIVLGIGEIEGGGFPDSAKEAEPSKLQTVINNGMELPNSKTKATNNLFK
ncbi:MAG: hypothetical protein WBP58_03500 [Chitinophagaceae bacterium]